MARAAAVIARKGFWRGHHRDRQGSDGSQYPSKLCQARRAGKAHRIAIRRYAAVLNGYDENALEEAMRLRERHGGRVTVLSLGDDSSRKSLKRALAMGADAAILLSDSVWMYADSATVGRALAAAICKIGKFDLVMCGRGRRPTPTPCQVTCHWIAETLPSCPLFHRSCQDRRVRSQPHLTVHRLIDGGHQAFASAIAGTARRVERNQRAASSDHARHDERRPCAGYPGWKLRDLGIAPAVPKVELRRLTVQTRTTKAQLIDGSSDAERGIALADKLHDMGLV